MSKPIVRQICLVVCLLISPVLLRAQSVKVSLNMQNARLKDVIESVEGQTRYLFAADAGINLDQRVSVQVKDVSLREVLDQLASQAGLLYSVNGSNILLSQKEPQRSRTLTGRVTDEAGEPLVGAGVRVEGQPTIGTVTDFAGAYSLPVPLDAAAIRVSYIGMEDAVNEEDKVTDDELHLELAPGAIYNLPPGKKVETVNPLRSNAQFESFVNTCIMTIASSMGIPKEVLVKKYETNYTAARAALLDFWRTV